MNGIQKRFNHDLETLRELGLLNEKTLDALKNKYILEVSEKIYNAIIKLAENIKNNANNIEALEKIKEELSYSPAGDCMGCDNYFFDFSEILETEKVCDLNNAICIIQNFINYKFHKK